MSKTKTYTVHALDVWGNKTNGYDVNDVYPSQGELTLTEGEGIAQALIDNDFIYSDFNSDKLDIDDSSADYNIYISYDGKPELELRRVPRELGY